MSEPLGRLVIGRVSAVFARDCSILLDSDIDAPPIDISVLALQHADIGPGDLVAVRLDDEGRCAAIERLEQRDE